MSAAQCGVAGFYGKVRTHGDFVGRGLPARFVAQWDAWLQDGLLSARRRDGDAWLDGYLAMPLWSFSTRPGVLGDDAYAGVLMPGIDAVGRYFPLVIARSAALAAPADSPWHRRAAALAMSTLAPSFSLDVFEAALSALDEAVCDGIGDAPPVVQAGAADSAWRAELDDRVIADEGKLDAALFVRLMDAG